VSTASAVVRSRGESRSSVGPGSSAWKIWRPAIASCGKTATNTTTMPMPPTHWVKARHMKSAPGTAPKSTIAVAPVAVNPTSTRTAR
jgi:hypothetical protein